MGRGYFGWWVVGGCFWVAVFGWGLGFYGLGVYLAELQRARGWSAGLISGAATLYYLVSAILVALVGEAIGRWGARRVVLGGSAAMGAGVLTLTIVREPWQLYAAYLLMTPGWAAMTTTAIAATLAPWFVRRRGLAISLALNGASCGGVFVAPALVLLSERFGFVAALRLVVGAMVCVLAPIALLVLGHRPGQSEAESEQVGDQAAARAARAAGGAAWTRAGRCGASDSGPWPRRSRSGCWRRWDS